MAKVTVLCVASLAIGASLGWMLHGEHETVVPRVASGSIAMQPAVSRSAIGVSSSVVDIEQIRTMLREELAAIARSASSGSAVPALIKEPAPTPELVAKRRVAAEEIETMIRGGEWGNEQRMAFHQRIAMLDAEQGARALREVTMALNNGTLQMTTDGPPL